MSLAIIFPRLKVLVVELVGTAVAGAGAITAQQAQFDYWFRQFGTLVAIVAGGATIYRIFRPRKDSK